MKNFKRLLLTFGGSLCAIAAFVTLHANDFISVIRFYQPELPEGFENFKATYKK